MTSEVSERILRIGAVLQRTGLSRSTLYRKIQAGSFPPQIKIAERCAGWRESDLQRWLKNPMFYDHSEFSSVRGQFDFDD